MTSVRTEVIGVRVHELKAWPDSFYDVQEGSKTAEFRRNDRGGFKLGDLILLREYIPTHEEWIENGGLEDDWEIAYWITPEPADGSKWDGEDHDEPGYWKSVVNRDIGYTGKTLLVQVTHVQTGFGIPDGYCMLSFERVRLS